MLILIYHHPFYERPNHQYDARGPRIADQHMLRSPLLRFSMPNFGMFPKIFVFFFEERPGFVVAYACPRESI
jgi:hypothetical protein